MRTVIGLFSIVLALLGVGAAQAQQPDLQSLVPQLQGGGYVIVFRHGATDPSQSDAVPFDFNDMSKQRQLSDAGRETAKSIGAALQSLGIPIGDVYTSQLNRAVETGKLIAGKDVKPTDFLTDSSGGSASGMAAGVGDNQSAEAAFQQLLGTKPAAGVNTVVVTHKTNIGDAFGDALKDIAEGEAIIVQPGGDGSFTVVSRVPADQWSAVAGPK
jgi:broad specificity phosphatase PhoE